MKKLPLLFFLLFPFIYSAVHADPLESLIDEEVQADQDWADDGDDLPPVYIEGDTFEPVICAESYAAQEGGIPLCEDFSAELLADAGPATQEGKNLLINTSLPRIRDMLTETCLVRPGDEFMAVGDGWQKKVKVGKLMLKELGKVCGEVSSLGLALAFVENLEERPLFYATDSELKEGSNEWPVPIPETALSDEIKALLTEKIKFFDEYTPVVFDVKAANCDRLIYLKRAKVALEDASLANEMIVSQKENSVAILIAEKVDPIQGSGQLRLKKVFDFNGDSLADIFVEGTNPLCFRKWVFVGGETGFVMHPLPGKTCPCP